jgi:hypothetical protein
MEYAGEAAQRDAEVVRYYRLLPISANASAVDERFGFGVAEGQFCPIYINHD